MSVSRPALRDKVKPIPIRKLPEKQPKSMQVPRKILKSIVKPTESQDIEEIKNMPKVEEQKEPKGRKRGKQGKEPLSLRKDVIYKTLIRSLKRYLTEKCDLLIDGCWTK